MLLMLESQGAFRKERAALRRMRRQPAAFCGCLPGRFAAVGQGRLGAHMLRGWIPLFPSAVLCGSTARDPPPPFAPGGSDGPATAAPAPSLPPPPSASASADAPAAPSAGAAALSTSSCRS